MKLSKQEWQNGQLARNQDIVINVNPFTTLEKSYSVGFYNGDRPERSTNRSAQLHRTNDSQSICDYI